MRDLDVFVKLLALRRPWAVERLALEAKTTMLTIHLRHRSNARLRCPECDAWVPVYDHTPLRYWRHLDHGGWLTYVAARVPRVQCLFHGLRRVDVPWALPGARCSLPFERHAIETLQETDVLGATRLLRISWDEAWGFLERAVQRGLEAKKQRLIPHLGIDEKAVAKGHNYVTLVNDLDRGTVEFIADDRKKASLDAYYESRTLRQRAGIRAVAMDMWEPYIRSTRAYLPRADGKIVFDRFHIMKHMNEAVDAVRKAEHRCLQAEDDDTLKRTKYLWLFAEENLPECYEDWFAQLKTLKLKTGRAWAIKEALRHLWSYQRKGWAQRYWAEWYYWATHSRLPPVVKVAHMLHSHLDSVLTYFDHRLTNAGSEGLNSKIQTVKKTPTVSATAST